MHLKNLKGEELDTKEKAIKSLIHTANSEQVPVMHIWCFKNQCEQFGIDPNNFYKQEMCDDCQKYGIEIYHYKDDEFEYKYDWKCC